LKCKQTREQVDEKFQEYQDKMKAIFDRREKQRNFIPGDLVLRWDSRREDPRKHGKFDHLWLGPYKIVAVEEIIHSPFKIWKEICWNFL
jgi:hypothetical protein